MGHYVIESDTYDMDGQESKTGVFIVQAESESMARRAFKESVTTGEPVNVYVESCRAVEDFADEDGERGFVGFKDT